jgi:hypothetical protein
MKQKHSWKKGYQSPSGNDVLHLGKLHNMIKVFKCRNCGLLKGTCRSLSYFPKLVYAKDGIILSTDGRIPYNCDGSEVIKKGEYFSPEDFQID